MCGNDPKQEVEIKQKSPIQILETKNIGIAAYGWRPGSPAESSKAYKWPDPGAPLSNELDAQIDELVEKGDAGQKVLMAFLRKLQQSLRVPAKKVEGSVKKPENIENKIKKRGYLPKKINDGSRATMWFTDIEELYMADILIQESNEFKEVVKNSNYYGVKNRYALKDDDGDYRDLKYFLAFEIPLPTPNRWIVELQLNLAVAKKGKNWGHGIYEVTRLFGKDLPQESDSYTIPGNLLQRIADKLQTSYVTGKGRGLLGQHQESFLKFVKKLQKALKSKTEVTVSYTEDKMLRDISKLFYKSAHRIEANAKTWDSVDSGKGIGGGTSRNVI